MKNLALAFGLALALAACAKHPAPNAATAKADCCAMKGDHAAMTASAGAPADEHCAMKDGKMACAEHMKAGEKMACADEMKDGKMDCAAHMKDGKMPCCNMQANAAAATTATPAPAATATPAGAGVAR